METFLADKLMTANLRTFLTNIIEFFTAVNKKFNTDLTGQSLNILYLTIRERFRGKCPMVISRYTEDEELFFHLNAVNLILVQ